MKTITMLKLMGLFIGFALIFNRPYDKTPAALGFILVCSIALFSTNEVAQWLHAQFSADVTKRFSKLSSWLATIMVLLATLDWILKPVWFNDIRGGTITAATCLVLSLYSLHDAIRKLNLR